MPPVRGRILAYCRVSSAEQGRTGTSLEGQRDALASWARSQGHAPPALFVEVESGSDLTIEARAEQLRLQREAQPGDTVIVTLLDRWSRDVPHAVSTVRALVKRGVGWIAVSEGLDASTRDGDSMMGIKAWAAEQERLRIRDRTVGRKLELKDKGEYVQGRRPFGLIATARKLTPHPDEAPIALDLVKRVVRGESLSTIVRKAPLPPKGKGTRVAWDKCGIRRIVGSRYLIGESPRSDGTWARTHEPVVPLDLWQRAQEALEGRRRKGRTPGKDNAAAAALLHGCAHCSKCGRRVSVMQGRVAAGTGTPGLTYKCAAAGRCEGECDARGVHVGRLDAIVVDAVLERLTELRQDLASVRAVPAPKVRAVVDHAGQLARLAAKRVRLVELRASDEISKDDLQVALAKLDAERAKVELAAATDERERGAAARAAKPETRLALLADVEHLRSRWARLSTAKRRQVLVRLASRVEVVPAKRAWSHEVPAPRITWRSLAELMSEGDD